MPHGKEAMAPSNMRDMALASAKKALGEAKKSPAAPMPPDPGPIMEALMGNEMLRQAFLRGVEASDLPPEQKDAITTSLQPPPPEPPSDMPAEPVPMVPPEPAP